MTSSVTRAMPPDDADIDLERFRSWIAFDSSALK
jgi:hypothetical protein